MIKIKWTGISIEKRPALKARKPLGRQPPTSTQPSFNPGGQTPHPKMPRLRSSREENLPPRKRASPRPLQHSMPQHPLTTPNLTRDSPSRLTESHQESPVITDLSPHAPDNNSDDSQVYWSNIIEQMKEEKEEFRKEIHRLQNLLEAALATKGSDSAEYSSSPLPEQPKSEPPVETPKLPEETPSKPSKLPKMIMAKTHNNQDISQGLENASNATPSVAILLTDVNPVTIKKTICNKKNMGTVGTILRARKHQELRTSRSAPYVSSTTSYQAPTRKRFSFRKCVDPYLRVPKSGNRVSNPFKYARSCPLQWKSRDRGPLGFKNFI